jgi:hypothetical protein
MKITSQLSVKLKCEKTLAGKESTVVFVRQLERQTLGEMVGEKERGKSFFIPDLFIL